jgi:hypothetical protein
VDEYERIRREYENLMRTAGRGIQDVFRAQDATMEDAARGIVNQLNKQETLRREASRGIIDQFNAQRAQLDAAVIEDVRKTYGEFIGNMDTRAFAAMSELADLSIRSNDLVRARIPELIDAEGIAAVVARAANAAIAPHTRDLLARASEAVRRYEAARGHLADDAALWPEGTVEPQLTEWLAGFDRESLIFLFTILLHSSAILGTSLGVAIAVEDGTVDAEDLGALLGAIHLLAAYVLLALQKKDKDE